jgi:hypothetical protein
MLAAARIPQIHTPAAAARQPSQLSGNSHWQS